MSGSWCFLQRVLAAEQPPPPPPPPQQQQQAAPAVSTHRKGQTSTKGRVFSPPQTADQGTPPSCKKCPELAAVGNYGFCQAHRWPLGHSVCQHNSQCSGPAAERYTNVVAEIAAAAADETANAVAPAAASRGVVAAANVLYQGLLLPRTGPLLPEQEQHERAKPPEELQAQQASQMPAPVQPREDCKRLAWVCKRRKHCLRKPREDVCTNELSALLDATEMQQHETSLRELGCQSPADLADCDEQDLLDVEIPKAEVKRLFREPAGVPAQGYEPDPVLVQEVKMCMTANKLSQVTVGQEARISQPVISQWLSLKYHSQGTARQGAHRDKVRTALTSIPTQRAARAQACLPVPVTRRYPGNTGPPREWDRK